MTAEINITIGPPSLPTLSKEQREADRAKRLDFDEQKKVEEDARVASNKQLKKFGFGLASGGSLTPGASLEELLRRGKHHKPKANFLIPDPAASRREPPLQLGAFWWDNPGYQGRTEIRVWSGDGTTVASAPFQSIDYPTDFGWAGGDFALNGSTSLWLATFGENTSPGYVHGLRERIVQAPGFVFPVNADTAILVVLWDVIRGWTAAAVTSDFGLPPSVPPNSPPPNSAYQSLGTIPLGYKVGYGDYIYGRGEAAFLVSKSTVRLLTVPSVFTSRPDAVIAGTKRFQAMTPGNVGGIFPTEPEDLIPGTVPPSGPPGMVSCPYWESNPAATDWLNSNYFAYTLGLDVAALFNDGSGPVPDSTLANISTVWSPEASASFNRREGAGPLTYAQRKAAVFWGSLKQTAFFRGPVDASENAPIILKAAMQMSDADYTALLAAGGPPSIDYTDSRLRQVKVAAGTPSGKPAGFPNSPLGGERLFWDWGKPDYCRAQLLEMGFTEEDLTP